MPDLDPSRPLGIWIRVAAAIVRTALEEENVVATSDALRWLEALENTALDALAEPMLRADE